MLETIREYSMESWTATGESDLARRLHGTYFATFRGRIGGAVAWGAPGSRCSTAWRPSTTICARHWRWSFEEFCRHQ